jgi:hypothetical protein
METQNWGLVKSLYKEETISAIGYRTVHRATGEWSRFTLLIATSTLYIDNAIVALFSWLHQSRNP